MKTMRNSVILIGRPGNDPQMKTTNNDKKKASYRLAVAEAHTGADRQRTYTTQWFNMVAWGKQADKVESLVRKGNKMLIHGTLHNNEWTNAEGKRQTKTEILIDGFSLIEEKKVS